MNIRLSHFRRSLVALSMLAFSVLSSGCSSGVGSSLLSPVSGSISEVDVNPQDTSALTTAANDFYCMSSVSSTSEIPALQALGGIRWVRVWINVDWNSRIPPGQFTILKQLHNAGIKTIAIFNQRAVPTSQQVSSFFSWALSQGMGEYIDIWEILNEVNVSNGKYWQGTPNQYVQNVLKPAWKVLHPAGEKVLGAPFSAWQQRPDGTWGWGTWTAQRYVNAGYLNFVYYAGSHPYTKTVDEMKTHLDEVKLLFGNKPVILSEWNFKPHSNHNTWKTMLDTVLPYVRSRSIRACYYRLEGITFPGSGGTWPGVIDGNMQPVQPFYNMIKAWPKS